MIGDDLTPNERMTDNLLKMLAESLAQQYQGYKSLGALAHDLRVHANNYTFDDGALCADLRAAANYLEALS